MLPNQLTGFCIQAIKRCILGTDEDPILVEICTRVNFSFCFESPELFSVTGVNAVKTTVNVTQVDLVSADSWRSNEATIGGKFPAFFPGCQVQGK